MEGHLGMFHAIPLCQKSFVPPFQKTVYGLSFRRSPSHFHGSLCVLLFSCLLYSPPHWGDDLTLHGNSVSLYQLKYKTQAVYKKATILAALCKCWSECFRDIGARQKYTLTCPPIKYNNNNNKSNNTISWLSRQSRC